MKFVITLLFLCIAHASDPLPASAEAEFAKPKLRSISNTVAVAVITSLLDERAEKVGKLFPASHIRGTLGVEIATKFHTTLESYQTVVSAYTARSALRNLANFCIDRELELFKLQNTRLKTDVGKRTYEYDTRTLRNILDFAQGECSFDLPSRKILSALKVVKDCLKSRSFVAALNSITAGALFPILRDHGLVTTGKITLDDISALIERLKIAPSY